MLDPDRLLWRPGEKLISIPAPRVPFYLQVGDIVTFAPWPERYIVTAAARSMNEIGDARFKMINYSFEAGVARLWPGAKWPQAIRQSLA